MKSIIQEASSISKAIELGWLKAGKPQQFSVKIFQESEKNFFGMTTKPAKIAILFNDTPDQSATRQPHATKTRTPVESRQEQAPKRTIVEKESSRALESSDTRKLAPSRPQEQRPLKEDRPPLILWTDDLTALAQSWIQESLSLLGLGHISFTLSSRKQLLKVAFSAPLFNDEQRQKHFFRSVSFLLLQTLRRQSKRPLRNARIVLISEK